MAIINQNTNEFTRNLFNNHNQKNQTIFKYPNQFNGSLSIGRNLEYNFNNYSIDNVSILSEKKPQRPQTSNLANPVNINLDIKEVLTLKRVGSAQNVRNEQQFVQANLCSKYKINKKAHFLTLPRISIKYRTGLQMMHSFLITFGIIMLSISSSQIKNTVSEEITSQITNYIN
ncbi:hypothetical protein ABPG72_020316 [Tetrahymena utriculariae]